jgi:hypothetical protein
LGVLKYSEKERKIERGDLKGRSKLRPRPSLCVKREYEGIVK